jgi:MEMO1 family protein
MGIIAGFIVPHPPLIVPSVGKGEERVIQSTIDAYKEVAQRIALLEPETIVLTSPHATLYADYFHISPGKGARGDLQNFGVKGGEIEVSYDTALVDKIGQLAQGMGIPAGIRGERDPLLDHAAYVPLHFINQAYRAYRLVRIGLSGLPPLTHYRFGQCIAEAADLLNRRVVFVASGDLSHKLSGTGPYGFAPEGPEFDKRVMQAASAADFLTFLEFDEDFCEKAAECGLRSFQIMAGALDGKSVRAETLSYEGPFGVGYGVVAYEVTGADVTRHFGADYENRRKAEVATHRVHEDPYVFLARQSLEHYLREGNFLDVPPDVLDELRSRRGGVFVSLKKEGRLRGCIGTLEATQTDLAQEIIHNAVSAGTEDPRFTPVTPDELDDLVYDVDVLGPMEAISSPAELDAKRYGVVVTSTNGYKRGLLLPDLDGVDTVEEQIAIAKHKAGIFDNEDYSLMRFEVIRHV